MNAPDRVEFGNQTRPWVRFWARSIDLGICTSIFELIWEAIGPPVNTKWVVVSMLYAFLWVPVEALLLSTWGTTPGKWLMRMTVRDSTGGKLTFSVALSRSLYVWAWGFGIGFFYAMLVAALFAYLELQSKGRTRWDREGGFRIYHGEIGMHRGIATIVLLVCIREMFVLSTDFITTPSSSSGTTEFIVVIGILLVISLVSLVSLKAENTE